MNYRHGYHAGNFADVMKHALQLICLNYLQQKDKPFFVLDTHAGIGMYDLWGEQSQKTGEWEQGIARLLAATDRPPELTDYCELVNQLNPDGELRFYPGSPWLAQHKLRAADQLALCELHPVDGLLLEENFTYDPQVQVHVGKNGYAALKALLPPPAKRGMVLIDPPFEERDEFEQVVAGLSEGLKRWANGVYAVWYPIKDPLMIGDFHQQVKALKGPKTYAVDMLIRDAQDSTRLNGCGMLFINPPYGLLQQLDTVMPYLTALLAQDEGASWQGQWVVSET